MHAELDSEQHRKLVIVDGSLVGRTDQHTGDSRLLMAIGRREMSATHGPRLLVRVVERIDSPVDSKERGHLHALWDWMEG